MYGSKTYLHKVKYIYRGVIGLELIVVAFSILCIESPRCSFHGESGMLNTYIYVYTYMYIYIYIYIYMMMKVP